MDGFYEKNKTNEAKEGRKDAVWEKEGEWRN